MRAISHSTAAALVQTVLLMAMALAFTGIMRVERPAGVRTALELIERKWALQSKAAPAMVFRSEP